MRSAIPAAIATLFAVTHQAARADDFSGDVAAVRAFLDVDASYSPSEREVAEAAFDKLKAGAGNMSPAAFQLAVAHITALARNGHTMLVPGVWARHFNRVPVQYFAFADGLFVIHAPATMRELLGARVISIDGRGADELSKAFGDYFGAREGKRDEWAGYFLESPALLHAAGLAKAADRVEVHLVLADGTKVSRTLAAALDPPPGGPFDFLDLSRLVEFAADNTKDVPHYLDEPKRAFRMKALPDLEAYYLQLRINVSFYEEKIDAFFASARSALEKAKPRHLVVDLRLNGGGDLNTTRAFFQALPSLASKDGRIFVLTSGRTFSAGIASAGYLKQAGGARVVIVGEPIGDHLEFWAEGAFTELPVSKATLLPATERHNYMTGCQEADCHESIRTHPIRVTSLEPDIAAPLTYGDYRAGRDVALDAVRKALGR
jgi:hypothetical protein